MREIVAVVLLVVVGRAGVLGPCLDTDDPQLGCAEQAFGEIDQ